VVVDFFLSETAALAEVVLPGSMWLETDGTMTNLEGRVLRRRKVQDTPGEAREDWKILCEIGARLGHTEKFLYQNVEEIFEDFVVSTRGAPADYSGLTYEKIGTRGVFWPCPHPNHPGTPEPFAKFFAHQDGRAHLAVVKYRDSAEMPSPEYPLFLTTGRDVNHYQSGTQTRRSSLNTKSPHALAQMHPSLAAAHNLENGAAVKLETKRGVGDFKVLYDEKMRSDTVFVSFHYAGQEAINRLTSAALDPVSRMPEFKVCAVKIAVQS
jgi:assimilatory nitrate reductase catalytic subunit